MTELLFFQMIYKPGSLIIGIYKPYTDNIYEIGLTLTVWMR